MNEGEMRYRVSAVVTSTLQIVVQARSSEEAEASADAIDFRVRKMKGNNGIGN